MHITEMPDDKDQKEPPQGGAGGGNGGGDKDKSGKDSKSKGKMPPPRQEERKEDKDKVPPPSPTLGEGEEEEEEDLGAGGGEDLSRFLGGGFGLPRERPKDRDREAERQRRREERRKKEEEDQYARERIEAEMDEMQRRYEEAVRQFKKLGGKDPKDAQTASLLQMTESMQAQGEALRVLTESLAEIASKPLAPGSPAPAPKGDTLDDSIISRRRRIPPPTFEGKPGERPEAHLLRVADWLESISITDRTLPDAKTLNWYRVNHFQVHFGQTST